MKLKSVHNLQIIHDTWKNSVILANCNKNNIYISLRYTYLGIPKFKKLLFQKSYLEFFTLHNWIFWAFNKFEERKKIIKIIFINSDVEIKALKIISN